MVPMTKTASSSLKTVTSSTLMAFTSTNLGAIRKAVNMTPRPDITKRHYPPEIMRAQRPIKGPYQKTSVKRQLTKKYAGTLWKISARGMINAGSCMIQRFATINGSFIIANLARNVRSPMNLWRLISGCIYTSRCQLARSAITRSTSRILKSGITRSTSRLTLKNLKLIIPTKKRTSFQISSLWINTNIIRIIKFLLFQIRGSYKTSHYLKMNLKSSQKPRQDLRKIQLILNHATTQQI